jgi:2-oxoglutarate dehydrogenase E1 component
VTREEAEKIAERRRELMQEEFQRVRQPGYSPKPQTLTGVWDGFAGGEEPANDEPATGADAKTLRTLLLKLTEIPPDFHLNRKLQRFIDKRRQMAHAPAEGAEPPAPLDWAAAEALAFATLAVEGHRVRLSGQDCARGTFSQRHAVLHDVESGRQYGIFQHLAEEQAPVETINSPLSEIGVLGFDYGFSLDYPQALVAWEAQFGDFNNAAQVIIDQFLSSAEDKWHRLSGLVLLLPHGFEGQGPEHSSARLERFLTLAAEDNMQIVCPSTPAQYFHCLRRQVKRRWCKPLVVLTPKSMLRNPKVVSPLEELTEGRFQRVLPDERPGGVKTRRLLLCSGKIYYELLAAREDRQRSDVAIVRVEQLYPLKDQVLANALRQYPDGIPACWVQEEPENMGAWRYWKARFGDRLLGRFPWTVVARRASASPATGSGGAHEDEQRELLERAL